MPSRRIATYPNLAPLQEISVNPFSSFNSNVVNKLTRIVSEGNDIIVKGLDIKPLRLVHISNSGNLVSSEWHKDNWEYDEDYVYPTLSNQDTVLDGFHITIDHNQPYNSTKLVYKIPVENYPINYFYGKDITRTIQCSFNILSGNPNSIIVDVGGDRKSISYPRGSGSKYTCQLKHNFLNDSFQTSLSDTAKDYFTITFYFILQANDPACSYENNSNTEGSTYIMIGRPEISIVYQNNNIETDYITSGSIDGNYSYQYIHPSNILTIDSGVLIKDDVMINPQVLDKSVVDGSIISLDISNKKSWIFGEDYSSEYDNRFSDNQKVYFLNGRDELIEYTGQFIDGILKVRGKFLDTGKNKSDEEIEVGLVDDLEISDGDSELDIQYSNIGADLLTVDNLTFNVPTTSIGKYHGSVGLWCYDTGDEKIVFKKTIFNLIDTDSGQSISGEDVVIGKSEIPVPIDENTISNIKCYLTLGPIKVSGDINQYDLNKIAWAYVVCYYSYYRHPEPNVSYYGLLKEEQLKDIRYREDYVVLAKLRLVDRKTFDIIDYQERQQQFDKFKNIKAKDVSYAIDLPLGDGFTERSYWKDTLDGEVSVPENVSDALSILAKRRLDDISREDDKLNYKKNITDNTSDTAKILVSDIKNNSKTISVVDSQNGNITTFKFNDNEAKNITFGNNNGYIFDTQTGLFECIDIIDNRFSNNSPTDDGFYWILKKNSNNNVHEQSSGSCILNDSEWVVIKRDDITYQLYPYFRNYNCNYILAKYDRIDEVSDGWKFNLNSTLIYISYDTDYPMSFFDSNNFANIFTFDILKAKETTLNTDRWISAKIPVDTNQAEDSLIGFGTKASTANLEFIKYNNSQKFFGEDNLGNYNNNNITSSTLSKIINRIPSGTSKDRVLVWNDAIGNIRDGSGELTESRVVTATNVCANGLSKKDNVVQYSSSDGALKDSGIPVSKLNRLDCCFIGPDSKIDIKSYISTNPDTDVNANADNIYIDTDYKRKEDGADDKMWWVSPYTKSYTTTSDGVLFVSIKWDCHNQDGLYFCIYNSTTDVPISKIRIAPDMEMTNSPNLCVSFSINLLSGIKVRFEETNNNPILAQAEGCYLEYVFFYN